MMIVNNVLHLVKVTTHGCSLMLHHSFLACSGSTLFMLYVMEANTHVGTEVCCSLVHGLLSSSLGTRLDLLSQLIACPAHATILLRVLLCVTGAQSVKVKAVEDEQVFVLLCTGRDPSFTGAAGLCSPTMVAFNINEWSNGWP